MFFKRKHPKTEALPVAVKQAGDTYLVVPKTVTINGEVIEYQEVTRVSQ